LSVEPEINSRKKDPIRLNGILSMTISENTGDSNCIAMTRNIRNTAVIIAIPIAINSSFIISSMVLTVCPTPSGNAPSSSACATASVMALFAVNFVSSVVYAIIET